MQSSTDVMRLGGIGAGSVRGRFNFLDSGEAMAIIATNFGAGPVNHCCPRMDCKTM